MSNPELIFQTDAPMTGHNTTWHLTYEGRPIDVKLDHGTRPLAITALDTRRDFKITSQRGQAILAQVLDAYAAQFGDDTDAEAPALAEDQDTDAAMPQDVDLTVTPQQGQLTPAPHLSAADAAQLLADWEAPAVGYTGGPYWTVGFNHKDGNHYTLTSTLRIPRRDTPPPFAARPELEAIDGNARTASLRRHPANRQAPHLHVVG